MSLDSEDIADLCELVTRRQKFPIACAKALRKINEANANSTERIFFNYGGIPAWAAYTLVQRIVQSTGHVGDKGKRRRLLTRIEALPLEARQESTVQLAAAIEPADKARIEGLFRKTCHGVQRREPRLKTSSRAPETRNSEGNGADTHNAPRSISSLPSSTSSIVATHYKDYPSAFQSPPYNLP
ncbi:unnamed protein product [Discula destructiva]